MKGHTDDEPATDGKLALHAPSTSDSGPNARAENHHRGARHGD
jgi:hypothetical protein